MTGFAFHKAFKVANARSLLATSMDIDARS